MTLWHKPTETAKGHGLVVVKKDKNIGILTAYEHRSQAPASRWCYLTELLKLEQENKKLQEKLEIAVKALEVYANEYSWYNYENWNNEIYVKCIFDNYGYEKEQEALAKIKEIK